MDMQGAIIPKSDQLNSDDLITGPMTVTITAVTVRGGQEQPVSVNFQGDNGKPYKPCKSMCRVMVTAWGADSAQYVGRSLTLYRDSSVKWGGMEVGGIRISHMSHIDSSMTMALTMTKSSRKPFTVRPLKSMAPPPAATADFAGAPSNEDVRQGGGTDGPPIDDAAVVKDIEAWCKKSKFDMAYDMCRSIADKPLQESTKARIDKAKAFVDAKGSI